VRDRAARRAPVVAQSEGRSAASVRQLPIGIETRWHASAAGTFFRRWDSLRFFRSDAAPADERGRRGVAGTSRLIPQDNRAVLRLPILSLRRYSCFSRRLFYSGSTGGLL